MIAFASFASREHELENVSLLLKSLRTFGGRYAGAPMRVYVSRELARAGASVVQDLADLGVGLEPVDDVDPEAAWYYYAQKAFAAARAESDCAGNTDVLAWLDEDTLILQEPAEFDLPDGIHLGYRPVMHRNVGLLYDQPVDAFWQRAYDLLSVEPDTLFPMETPADGEIIRPYFNAGCLIVRPRHGLLAKWAGHWPVLSHDPELRVICEADVKKRIFLHQVALTCAVLNHLRPEERLKLSGRINYPIFFQDTFGAARTFNDLTGVVTLRHESYFRDPAPDWEQKLKGPADRIAWIKTHLCPELDDTQPG
jgi:hypothetical protein